tara:strand:- start:23 stop:397 length:375 start_codon:yes stop_codon:yes gene_type:complete
MTDASGNLTFSLREVKNETEENITYDDLVQQVDYMEMYSAVTMDDYIAQELEYNTNYTKKELEKIAEYYEISKRKKKKQDLVEDIVLFEKAPENVEMVYRRKRLWSYIEEIKADKYLSKYLIFE